jgi:hypothetical protein
MADPKQQQDINQLSTQDKLGEALNRALPLLPKEVRERVQELASPESVSAIATIGAVYVASHAVGIGELGDAAILEVGAIALGSEVINVAKDLSSFVQVATQAKNEADLDRAAEHLARAVSRVSVDAVAAVLTRKAGKVVEEKLSQSPARGLTEEKLTKTAPVPERPSLPRESGQSAEDSKTEAVSPQKQKQKNLKLEPNEALYGWEDWLGFERHVLPLVTKSRVIKVNSSKQQSPMRFFEQWSLKIVKKQNQIKSKSSFLDQALATCLVIIPQSTRSN